jgi:mannose-6-phosphate isomerase-like protein (cupin superfamily)
VEFQAGGGPPLLHRHAPQEVYRVERGELTIYLEEAGQVRRIPSPAGAVVHIPAGRVHTVRNESENNALAYVVFTPGAEMERFVRAAARLGADRVPAADDLLALAGSHGIEMVGPAPVASG